MGITHFADLSVKDNGYYFGAKGSEVQLTDGSGVSSGRVRNAALVNAAVTSSKLGAGLKIDCGAIGFSGIYSSMSTALSSVIWALATPKSIKGGSDSHSGLNLNVNVGFSGHCIDFKSCDMSGLSTSSIFSWAAMGL